jgi:hypothetical protein
MEGFFILVLIGFIIAPIAALIMASGAKTRVSELESQLEKLRSNLEDQTEFQERLKRRIEKLESASAPTVTHAESTAHDSFLRPAVPPVIKAVEEPVAKELPATTPPPPSDLRELMSRAAIQVEKAQSETAPPPSPPRPTPPKPPELPKLNLEQFMGAKLFAWVGGLAMFLGILFFVKLSFERGWISPGMRVAIGFLIGVALLVGGVLTHRRRQYVVLGQTLCATGIVALYGVSFAAHSLYQLVPFDSPLVTFAFMALVTVTAFLLAVRLDARVVAVLGMLGGFLTPPLCSTGQDHPFGLFSYIALLVVGVMAVVKHKRWMLMVPLAVGGTLLMQGGWLMRFFDSSGYAHGSATWIPIGVFLVFGLLFAAAVAWVGQRKDEDDILPWSAIAVCSGAMLAVFVFMGFSGIATRPVVLYSFVFGLNILVLGIIWLRPGVAGVHGKLIGFSFLHLAIWTMSRLNQELLIKALVIYLAFGLLHTAFAVLWMRRGEKLLLPVGWTPIIALLLLLLPVLTLDTVGFAIWPAILLVNVIIIALAAMTGVMLPVLVALVLTLITAGAWLFRLPGGHDAGLGGFLFVVGGFAVLFSAVGVWLARKMPKAEHVSLVPVSSAVMPFALLILATFSMEVPNPSPIFGLALLLSVFLLGIVQVSGITQLAVAAMGCVIGLEWVWHAEHFSAASAVVPLLWYVGFYLLFTAFPFLFRAQFAERRLPWITSAAAGLGSFGLVYRAVKLTWPNYDVMGLLPLAFAIAPLLALIFVIKHHRAENPARLTQLAWFGGVALFFITLIFPIQFEKQWITLGWALEGAALCWLYRRVPHPGLRGTGAVLLAAAFARLALNPAVLSYQVRSESMLLNWQLYAYSLAALAMFAAARWLEPPKDRWGPVPLRPVFFAFGGVLLFLLVNIEIADAFTPVGASSLVFKFGGDFARDMTYTIAWAVFALGLIILGLWKRVAPTRYVGIGLLAVTILKLFLHDLARIDSVYRIGALIVVAIIALAASFLYQRFLGEEKDEQDSNDSKDNGGKKG